MKLVTFSTSDGQTHAGVVSNSSVITLAYPTLLELLRDPAGLPCAASVLQSSTTTSQYALDEVTLLPPVPDPPTMRDFYAFEQHVKTCRKHRGLDMVPEWYKVPVFYFSNPAGVIGHDDPVSAPHGSKALDYELELACIIGKAGRDLPADVRMTAPENLRPERRV